MLQETAAFHPFITDGNSRENYLRINLFLPNTDAGSEWPVVPPDMKSSVNGLTEEALTNRASDKNLSHFLPNLTMIPITNNHLSVTTVMKITGFRPDKKTVRLSGKELNLCVCKLLDLAFHGQILLMKGVKRVQFKSKEEALGAVGCTNCYPTRKFIHTSCYQQKS